LNVELRETIVATLEVALPAAVGAPAADAESAAGQVSQWRLMWWRFLQNRLSVVGGIVLVVLYLVAALAPFLAPYDANDLDGESSYAEPTKLILVAGRPAVCPPEQEQDSINLKLV
jgi:hypothetical protein